MGASFTNYQAHTCNVEGCTEALAGVIQARALVSDAEAGWVSVYDEQSESQDERELERVAKELSSKLATEVFAFLVHDSDIFIYLLYRKGKLVDRFNSRPDYFGPTKPAERKKWAGHFDKLLLLARNRTTPEQLQQTMAREHVFEDERAAEFANLMGINPERARSGFKYLQQQGHDFQLVHGTPYSPRDADLAEAVEKGDIEKVSNLLANHCSPNGKNQLGESLLVQALRCRRTEVAIALLDAGADPFPNPQSDALLAAASIGYHEIVVQILKSQSPKLKERLTDALAHAVLQGHSEIVEDLLKLGADPNLAGTDGGTPLMIACARGNETVREIVTGQRTTDRPGAKPTVWVAIVSALLKAGANVNARNDLGLTALMMAKGSGQQEVVEMLLKAGADPTIKPGPKFVELLDKLRAAGLGVPQKTAVEGGKSSANPAHLDPRVRKILLEQITVQSCKKPKK